MGPAYGTAKSGTGIAAMAVIRPEDIMKSIILAIDAGSSSIRCNEYEYTGASLSSSTSDVVDDQLPSDSSTSPSLVNAI